jgi:hypothetical protein
MKAVDLRLTLRVVELDAKMVQQVFGEVERRVEEDHCRPPVLLARSQSRRHNPVVVRTECLHADLRLVLGSTGTVTLRS